MNTGHQKIKKKIRFDLIYFIVITFKNMSCQKCLIHVGGDVLSQSRGVDKHDEMHCCHD